MKKYKIIHDVVTGNGSLVFYKDEIINENRFNPNHIDRLIDLGAIEEITE